MDGRKKWSWVKQKNAVDEITGEGFKIVSTEPLHGVSSKVIAVCPKGHTVKARLGTVRDLGCPACRKATNKVRRARK